MTSPRLVLGERDLNDTVARLAGEISAAYPDGVLLVAVLKGSVLFVADLVRAVTVPVEVDFMAISSYAPDSGRVRIVKDLGTDISDRDVVLVEDIIDTGLTVTYLVGELRGRRPRTIEVCALLDKRVRRIVPVPVRFRGVEIGDDFVLGYGLDFAGRYRNLRYVVAGDMSTLQNDPDAHVHDLYGG